VCLVCRSTWTWVSLSLTHHLRVRNQVKMRKHFPTSCSRRLVTTCEVSMSSDSWSKKVHYPHLYLYSILGSVCVCENDTFAALFQHIYMHLLVERVFVHWRWIILTVTDRNKLKLKENICYWSVHVTSHIRDMRSILNAVHSVRLRHGEMCLGKYLCLYFFKEYKVL
jgi:hypothetical protein